MVNVIAPQGHIENVLGKYFGSERTNFSKKGYHLSLTWNKANLYTLKFLLFDFGLGIPILNIVSEEYNTNILNYEALIFELTVAI